MYHSDKPDAQDYLLGRPVDKYCYKNAAKEGEANGKFQIFFIHSTFHIHICIIEMCNRTGSHKMA